MNLPSSKIYTKQDLIKAVGIATKAVRGVASRLSDAIRNKRENEIHFKGEIDIQTDLDLWSEQTLSMTFKEAYPSAVIIGEESFAALVEGEKRSLQETLKTTELAWVIDPIDGTNNFSNHIPHIAISVALLSFGKPLVGVVLDPVRDELYCATEGGGATLNGQRISPSSRETLKSAICGISFPVDREGSWEYYWSALEPVVLSCRTARVLGSGVLNLCWTAGGRLDGLVEHNLKIWDVAAGYLIAKEAGCSVGNCDTKDVTERSEPVDLFKRSLVVSGPKLFSPLCNLVQASRKNI